MRIKESHELTAQVFGGGGRRDTLNEVEIESRGPIWMTLPAASRVAKKS